MNRLGTKTVSTGMNRATGEVGKQPKWSDPDVMARAFHRKVQNEKNRHRRLMLELVEEGLDCRPFTRQDAAVAWELPPNKAGEMILELREVGFLRKSRDFSRCVEFAKLGREEIG